MKTLIIKSYSKQFTEQVLMQAHKSDTSSSFYGDSTVNGKFLTAIARKVDEHDEIEITTDKPDEFNLKEIFDQFI